MLCSSEISVPPSSTPPPTHHGIDNATFSDQPTRPHTPPSSPPTFPWELQRLERVESEDGDQVSTTPVSNDAAQNVFSVLGKRKPLATISDNARPKKQRKPNDAKPLTQMQISLGQRIQTKCKQCGMEYVASTVEDRRLHDKFHKQHTEGYDVGKDFVAKTDPGRLFRGTKTGDAIVALDCTSHGHRKNRGQAALEVVQKELGAVPIPKEDIWDVRNQQIGNPRYRAYLYVRGTKCIGFLLVENIQEALHVVQPVELEMSKQEEATSAPNRPADHKNALEALRARKRSAEKAQKAAKQALDEAANHPIQLSTAKHPAVLGISRIWASSTHREQGIATCLLDTAVQRHNVLHSHDSRIAAQLHEEATASDAKQAEVNGVVAGCFNPSRKIERKDQIAFSQPTDSGAKLARKWFGKAYGWSVYVT